MSIVEQRISSWGGWPDDVATRLLQWNKDYLLSFRRGPDFLCGGCGREIKAHPNGNAVLRPWRKAHGVVRCEDCVIAIARAYEQPPASLAPHARRLDDRLRERIAALEKKILRLREQIGVDQTYIDRLEAEISIEQLQTIHAELRGLHRRDAQVTRRGGHGGHLSPGGTP